MPGLGEVAQFMLGCGSLGTLWMTYSNGRKSAERSAVQVQKLEEIHISTNGLSERNEAIAKKLGIAEGTAAGLREGREETK
jgi:hypothetical protein